MAKSNSSTIQTAFILSILAGASTDLFTIYLFYSGVFTYSSTFNVYTLILVSCIAAAPIVLGAIALNLIGKAKPVTPRDKVFRILAKIFSIISIVEGCLLVFAYLIIMMLVLLFISVY